MIYENELKSLKKASLFRKRELRDDNIIDLASNDYLGLASNKGLYKKAFNKLLSYKEFSPKSSLLLNGYAQIHKEFEDYLIKLNSFESCILVSNGFCANLSLIEALPRRKDSIFIDEDYHVSGNIALKLVKAKVNVFKHNDANILEDLIKKDKAKRKFIAVEGVYSMQGDLLNKDIIFLADKYSCILLIDEAHSCGVIGDNLRGILDYYSLKVKENYIKMGTCGKAYGSYGAYILANSELISFLENRAKPIIYSTAPSLFDTALSYENLKYIEENKSSLKKDLKKRQKIVKEYTNTDIQSLIYIKNIANIYKLNLAVKFLKEHNFLLAGIKPPTVKKPLLRIIPRLGVSLESLKEFFMVLKKI